MLIAAIIIYVILAFIFGLFWPVTMFARGGCLGQLIVIAWGVLLYFGITAS